jgi:transcription termination factor Rho
VLAGGVDATALHPAKRFFGAARNIENGGSLTILATATVDSGSATDEVILEELSGTGNAEIRLSRSLAERRLFPAIDVHASGTRREDLLLSPEEEGVVAQLRLSVEDGDSQHALESLLDRLRRTRTNLELLRGVQQSAPRR